MDFEDALVLVDNLVFAQIGRHLSEAEITILKGAWNDYDYEEIANNSPYSLNYLQRRLAPQLWDVLSATIGNGNRVYKKNIRNFLEQLLSSRKYHTQLLSEQPISTEKSVRIIERQLPDISSFYGRTQELSDLKKIINKQPCISLIGVPGIGKSALAAKLIEELSVESQPRFDCFIWKSVAHVPLVQDLVAELIELIQPVDPLPEYTQARITVLLKQLQSRRCLLVLDEFDLLFQRNNFEQRLEYRTFFRRLVEEQHQSCLLSIGRVLPNEFDSLTTAKRPIQYFKIKGLDTDAAMQLLAAQGLTDQQKCHDLITTYRGNPLELQTAINKIKYFFAGNTKTFFENPTTFVSSEFEAMLDQAFGAILSELQKKIMIYLAERMVSNSKFVNFTTLLSDLSQKQNLYVSTSEIIKGLENLERQSLIEINKDPITQEISFALLPVIKKYITLDPLGLVHTSHTSPQIAIAS
jgi:hypothetical protein